MAMTLPDPLDDLTSLEPGLGGLEERSGMELEQAQIVAFAADEAASQTVAAIEVANLYRRMDSEQGLQGKEKKLSHGV